jgi:hypothetical protein
MSARRKYDWDGLFNQEFALLEKDIDYHCSQSNIIQQIRNEASKRRLRVRITDSNNQVIIRVLGAKCEV